MEVKQSVALLGLGTMGHGMAVNLLKAGVRVTVWNRTRSKAEPLERLGAAIAETPAGAAATGSIVIAMLADDDASRSVWIGEGGALAAMSAESIAIECSTLSPDWIAELDAAVKQRGLSLVEAPVTGSRAQAEAGQLTFLVGSTEKALGSVANVLGTMSKEILHVGGVGSGTQLKLINNFLCAVQVTSFAEALGWIERSGLREETALDFLRRGAPGSGIFAAMSDRMTKRTYEVNFLLRLMAKDLRYARAAAAAHGVALSTALPAIELFRTAQDQELGEKDMAAVAEVVRAGAGTR